MVTEHKYATAYPDVFAKLADPFDGVKTRNQGGRSLSYITARMAQNRLDDVVGPENWRVSYHEVSRGVVCTVGVRLPSGEWLERTDVGGYAGMEVKNRESGQMEIDEENDVKTAYSDSFKRACVGLGIGRYLYNDGVPEYAFSSGNNQSAQRQAEPPRQQQRQAPAAQPAGAVRTAPRTTQAQPSQGNGDNVPRTGRALFAWCKKRQEETNQDWVAVVNDFGEANGLPARMVDWNESQVADAYSQIVGSANAPNRNRELVGAGVGDSNEDGIPF